MILKKALRSSLYRRGELGTVTVTKKYVSRGTGYPAAGSYSLYSRRLPSLRMPQIGTPLFAHAAFHGHLMGFASDFHSDSASSIRAERFLGSQQNTFLVVSGLRVAATVIAGFFLLKAFLSLFHSGPFIPHRTNLSSGTGLTLPPHPAVAATATENWAQEYYRRVHTYYESKHESTLSSAAVAGVSSLSVGSLGTPPYSVGFRSVLGRPLSFFVGVSVATFMVFCIKIILQAARDQMKRRALMVEATEGMDVLLMDSAEYYFAAKSEVPSWPEDSGDGSMFREAAADPSPTPSISFRPLLKSQPAEPVQGTETSPSLISQVKSRLGQNVTMAVNLPNAQSASVIDVSTDVSTRDNSTSKDEGVKERITQLESEQSPSRGFERSILQKQNPGEPMIVLLSVISYLWDGVFQSQTARTSTVITNVCVESSRESVGKPLMYRANYYKYVKPRDSTSLSSAGGKRETKAENELSLQKYDAVGTIVHGLLEQSAIDPNDIPREKLDPLGQLLDAQFSPPPRGVQPYDAFGNLVMSISAGADTLSNGTTPLSALVNSANENVTAINYRYCPVSQLLTHRDWLVSDWAGVGSQGLETKPLAGKYDPVGLLIREWADSSSDGTTSRLSVSRYDPIGQLLAFKSVAYEELQSIKYDPISTLLKSQRAWDRHENNKYDPVGSILVEIRGIKAPSLDDNNGPAWDPVWWLLRGLAGRWVKEG